MQPNKFVLILAQVFISGIMAFLMTGVFGPVLQGLPANWFSIWMSHFVVAWPVAFVFSLVVGPVSFWMAERLARRLQASPARTGR